MQRQADRLKAFAVNAELKNYKVIKEVGSGMNENRKQLNRVLQDASMGTFLRTIERKVVKFNNVIYKVDTFYPSSKTCCNCGQVKAKLDLSERVYYCDSCGCAINRDLNAAINLKNVAASAAETLNDCGGNVRLLSLDECQELSPKNLTEGRKQLPSSNNLMATSGAFAGNGELISASA